MSGLYHRIRGGGWLGMCGGDLIGTVARFIFSSLRIILKQLNNKSQQRLGVVVYFTPHFITLLWYHGT